MTERYPHTPIQSHEFVPHHPEWHMPRCKICREFKGHWIHEGEDEPVQNATQVPPAQ